MQRSLMLMTALVSAAVLVDGARAEQLVLTPTSDGFAAGTTDLNFTRLTTNTSTLTVYRFDGQTDQRPLWEFDASGLPEGALVTGAALEFTVAFYQTPQGADIVAFSGDGQLTLSDATAAAEAVGVLNTPTGATSSSNIFKSVPLAVDGVLGGLSSSNGLVTIRMQAAASGVYFAIYATEAATAAYRPRLVITYELPPPPPPPPPRAVAIDVVPDSPKNNLSLSSKKTFPVAVFSTPDFDALTIDDLTVGLADPTLLGAVPAAPLSAAIADVDLDGLNDLVLTFAMPDLVAGGAIDSGTQSLELRGFDFSGREIFGADHVAVKSGPGKGGGK